jgi:AbrB family looped-hinge helix DNA binding protein
MITTVSPKYQIVIPKDVRKLLKIRPGQKMQVDTPDGVTIVVKQAGNPSSYDRLSSYAGSIKTEETGWGKQGLDATLWLRKHRDHDWS